MAKVVEHRIVNKRPQQASEEGKTPGKVCICNKSMKQRGRLHSINGNNALACPTVRAAREVEGKKMSRAGKQKYLHRNVFQVLFLFLDSMAIWWTQYFVFKAVRWFIFIRCNIRQWNSWIEKAVATVAVADIDNRRPAEANLRNHVRNHAQQWWFDGISP